jgi:type VI secretion system secreted protein Hcp
MATNMYLRFEQPEVTGSSTAPDHHGEIEVLAWSHGFVQPTSPSRRGGGPETVEQATHQNLTLTKNVDSATSELMKACWSGRQFGKATLTCFRAGANPGDKPVEYLTVVMEHVIVSNYALSAAPSDLPMENVGLDYGIVEYRYTEQKPGSTPTIMSARHSLETGTVE